MMNEKVNITSRSFEFAIRVVRLCQVLSERPGVPRTLANQLLRSGTSIGANIEEGQAGQSKADFIAKMSIARKEARETHYWLRLLEATQITPPNKLADLIEEADQLIRILTAIVKKSQQAPK
jgi:four helix bundle protein